MSMLPQAVAEAGGVCRAGAILLRAKSAVIATAFSRPTTSVLDC
jgi:hypothetical protein